MQDGVYIHNKKILWIFKGQRISLSFQEAEALIEELQGQVGQLQEQLAEDIVQWEELQALDSQWRMSASPVWLDNLMLVDGRYHVRTPILLSSIWSSLDQFEWGVHLFKLGAFDDLLWQDQDLPVQTEHPLLTERLRAFSEPMEWMEPCSFEMGSDSLEAWDFESPVHTVELATGFWVGRYVVTQQLYWSVMGTTGDIAQEDRGALKPMVKVSWYEALMFCNRLSLMTGRTPVYSLRGKVFDKALYDESPEPPSMIQWNQKANGYRLLTESEWEVVAGAFQNRIFSGSDDPDEVAWTIENSQNRLHNVGQKKANALGVFDMSGLVWEWCWDGYDSAYYENSPVQNPQGTHASNQRVCRGGSFLGDSSHVRISLRGRALFDTHWRNLGFRIACAE